MLIALAASCNTEPKTAVQKKVDSYALVKIESPDLSGITDNGKEVLNLYKFAADQADSIYWKQYFGDKTLIENLKDADLRDYAKINYGPWDRLDGSTFIEGFGELPLGANFYPADMTAAEFDSLADPVKTSPYSLIRRGATENSLLSGIMTLSSTTSIRSATTSRPPLTSPSSRACATIFSRRSTR